MKIYYCSFFWPEEVKKKKRLCYDFSKEKGDTIYYCRPILSHNEENIGYIYADKREALEEGAYEYDIVRNVSYKQGRKIMDVGYETWIEGIGSTQSFFHKYRLLIDGYQPTITHTLYEMSCNHKALYILGNIIDPNYKISFLSEGKSWHVKDEEDGSIYQITIGTPFIANYYPQYPVKYEKLNVQNSPYSNASFCSNLVEVNGCIYWNTTHYGLLYNFNLKKGQQIRLYKEFKDYPLSPLRIVTENYDVSNVDSVECNGTLRKRFLLEGKDTLIWVERIGSLKDPLYTFIYMNGKPAFNKDSNKVTCCYQNNELLYQNPDYTDCTTPRSSVEQHSLLPEFYYVNGNRLIIWEHESYRLSLYNSAGVLIHTQKLSSREERIVLPTLSIGILIGKLENGKQPALHFKIPLSDL